nr:transporter substrate-binding domain-containing protein [Desulfobacula sp.]
MTGEERAWLNDHPIIRVVQDPGWPPVEFADSKRNPSGMTSDYLKIIEDRLGVRFERVTGLSWQEAYTRLQKWEIDMTTSVAVTPERKKFWIFTQPYMKIPIVIFAQANVTYISNMRELSGKKIAIVDGYAVNDWIPRDFPDILLVKAGNSMEGLDLIQKGDVFAYIDNMLVVSYYLAKQKTANVKIVGETPYVNAQSMAVRKDWPVLAEILQKALDSISEAEHAAIYQKWVPIRYEHGVDHRLLWQALAVFFLILSGLVVWNRKLSMEIRHRKEAEVALGRSEERSKKLFRVAAVPLCYIDKEGILADINDRFIQTFGYTLKEVPCLAELYRLACPDPEYRRWVAEAWETGVKKAVKEKKDIDPMEVQARCKNGEVRTVLISGSLLDQSILAAFFDITERKQAEEK